MTKDVQLGILYSNLDKEPQGSFFLGQKMGLQDFDPAQRRSSIGEAEQEVTYPIEKLNGTFYLKDFVSVEQFTDQRELEILFQKSDEMKRSVEEREEREDLRGYTVAEVFYQASTRTFTSFQAAAQRLGVSYLTAIHGMKAYSSVSKGESLRDTIRTFEATTAADLIVLRHEDDNSSEEAAFYAKVPIINAGSGRKEHPTQAILDLYTIREELGRTDDLVVTMTGDLRNGRTIKSLAKLLVLGGKNIKFNFVSPKVLKMPDDVVNYLQSRGAEIDISDNGALEGVLPTTDVLYVTRIQSEWFGTQALEEIKEKLGSRVEGVDQSTLQAFAAQVGDQEYRKAVHGYQVNAQLMNLAKSDMIVMHPLPRVGEIAYDVDNDPRAAYFPQMRYGLYTRMALLSLVLNEYKIGN